MAIAKQIFYFTQEQYNSLVKNGSITIGEKTYTYDDNAIYYVQQTPIVIDKTLSNSGQAADAGAVGEALEKIGRYVHYIWLSVIPKTTTDFTAAGNYAKYWYSYTLTIYSTSAVAFTNETVKEYIINNLVNDSSRRVTINTYIEEPNACGMLCYDADKGYFTILGYEETVYFEDFTLINSSVVEVT